MFRFSVPWQFGLNAVRTSVLITVDKDKVRMYGFCATVDKRNRQIVDCTLVLVNKFLGVSYSGRKNQNSTP